jgi:mutator protein MutT
MTLPKKQKQIGVAVIFNDQGQVLIDRRPAESSFGGLWEFPGGKLEAGETIEQCIVREVEEEIGIQVRVTEPLITLNHDYPQVQVTLAVYLCEYLSGTPQTIACEEVRWVAIAALGEYQFPEANQAIIDALEKRS